MAKLWGGRFSKEVDPLVDAFTKSIHYDQRLAIYDCIGSLIHIDILKDAKLLTLAEHKKLQVGLNKILQNFQDNRIKIDVSFEDIHSFIQHLLEKNVGDVALKLHTCRSRNDQIVFDMKCFCLIELCFTQVVLKNTIDALETLGLKNKHINIPGLTHFQHAIAVKLSDYLDAYAQMLFQDYQRLGEIAKRIELTMGSGALAGTMIEAKHYQRAIKKYIGLDVSLKAPVNSVYTVSDRDFIIETLNALALIGTHLSRLAEEFILWSTTEFGFIDIDDSFCTGSSLMPQKKNPDVLELIRGYAGTLYGNALSVSVMIKGLPLSYNRDMQLDKEPLFSSLEITQNALNILTKMLSNIKFNKEKIDQQLKDECLYATDLADHLVKNKVAFKTAHKIIGELIHYKISSGIKIVDMSEGELKKFHSSLNPTIVKKIIDVNHSIQSKKSIKRHA